ncbi:TetR/AcrR family transcriptional regulator [Gordonia sp. LSe1-13]|uniref:TetR/AcrR family transcriptional regulator n=1 Tax=Gordonia sesuvii TaxID=3116777 RepID=A0ABU7MIW7_9ACTN|nr:TetR/AcrR family transcriptional regulator [Gordonia sp. LSe1-13]
MPGSPAATGRKAQITRVAAELFNDKGFHETSMDDIASAVGIKKPTLYHHVQSKAQIVSWIHDECVEAILPPLQGYLKSDMSSSDVLRRVAGDIFSLLDGRPGYLRVYFEHHRDLDKRSRTRIAKKRDQYFDAVRQAIENGNESGEFEVEDPKFATLAFFGMCNWGYQWYRPGGPETAVEVADHLWRVFLTGALQPGVARLG